MVKIGIIIGSTRPGRNAEAVAKWVYERAQKRTDAEFELIDIADYDLPYWMNLCQQDIGSILGTIP